MYGSRGFLLFCLLVDSNFFCTLNAETKAIKCLPRRSAYEHNFLYAAYSVLIVAPAESVYSSLCCTVKKLHGKQDIAHKVTTPIPKVLKRLLLYGHCSNVVFFVRKIWVLTRDKFDKKKW